jgi:peptidyl-prolyl cis-trans isomerase SurA
MRLPDAISPRWPRATAAAVLAVLLLAPRATAATGTTVECVLAKVNDEIITLTDYERQKKTVLEDLYRQKLDGDELQKHLDEARDRLLPSLIEERLMTQKSADLGLSVTKDEVDRIVDTIMEQNKLEDEAALDRALKAEGLTVATLRSNIQKKTLVEKLKQYEIASKIVVTEEEARRYYEEQKEDFRDPERVRLREVVLLLEKREPEQVRKEIEEIAALVRNGADFAELASLFSQAPTAEHGGDLGLIKTTDLAPEIAAAASALEPGNVSAPVQTKFGFHILKLVERKPVTFRSFEESRDEIARKIQDSRYGDRMTVYIEELKKGAFIQINEACKQHAL